MAVCQKEPVVSNVSLTRSLRCQFINCMATAISNMLLFCWENLSFCSSHFFEQKINVFVTLAIKILTNS